MTETTGLRIRRIYGIVLTVLTVLVGALFIKQVWTIFLIGENSFTVENISAHFSEIALPVWLWVAAVVLGGGLSVVFPDQKQKPKAYTDLKRTLRRLKERLPADGTAETQKHDRLRTAAWIATAIVCIFAAVVALVFLFDSTYTPRFETEFFTAHDGAADRLARILPWIAAAFAVVCIAVAYDTYSVKKETEQIKKLLTENAKKGMALQKPSKKNSLLDKICQKMPWLRSEWMLVGIRVGLCVLGLALFVVGMFDGGMTDVFEKAKNICTQCIGLG